MSNRVRYTTEEEKRKYLESLKIYYLKNRREILTLSKLKRSNRTQAQRSARSCYEKLYRKQHPEAYAQYSKKWRLSHPERARLRSRRARLKSQYGITLERYDELLLKQAGRCALCGATESKNHYSKLAVDHDHRTNRVRALLCHNCNALLGQARESIELLKKAIAYLEEFNGCR